jgi:hypothetical protein
LSALIRLGKVIHYEKSERNLDLKNRFPCVKNSRFWLSEGQTEIKRTEARIRIWRNIIAQAQRTLSSWYPEGDLLGSERALEKIIGKNFKEELFNDKISTLFGDDAPFHETVKSQKEDFLKKLVCGWRNLRNNVFHFKPTKDFLNAIKNLCEFKSSDVHTQFLNEAFDKQKKRIIEQLEGSHVTFFLQQTQVDQIRDLICNQETSLFPLPRFHRVLERGTNAWGKKLPPAPNRDEMESRPAVRMRYIVMKLIYEKSFSHWLEKKPYTDIKHWIEEAQKQSTEKAKKIIKDDTIVSKNTIAGTLLEGENLGNYFDRVAGLINTSYRIEKGYEPDPEKARKNSAFLENLKLDVILLAFFNFIEEKNLTWLKDFNAEEPLPETKKSSILPIEPDCPSQNCAWEIWLYILLHMVPVEEIAGLRNQCRKWLVLEKKAFSKTDLSEMTNLIKILNLYIDTHDCRYGGQEGEEGFETIKDYYELAPQSPQEKLSSCPLSPSIRGLREINRFATLRPLDSLFKQHKIPNNSVPPDLKDIIKEQKTLDKIHKEWIKNNKKLDDKSRNYYENALKIVITRRHSSSSYNLIDHLTCHRLMTKILGRLVDYAGLWERDIYFTLLALLYRDGKQFKNYFTKCNEVFKKGIVEDIDNLKKDGVGKEIKVKIMKYFNDWKKKVCIRNDIMHFNDLKMQKEPPLTKFVNDTRRLLSHDRKLQNAVAPSIIELLEREGIILRWKIEANHDLKLDSLTSKQIFHLGGKGPKEKLHSDLLINFMAKLFNGEAKA